VLDQWFEREVQAAPSRGSSPRALHRSRPRCSTRSRHFRPARAAEVRRGTPGIASTSRSPSPGR
jgi:hypothetical protein